MARGWMCVVLTLSWLGLSSPAMAQPQPAPGAGPIETTPAEVGPGAVVDPGQGPGAVAAPSPGPGAVMDPGVGPGVPYGSFPQGYPGMWGQPSVPVLSPMATQCNQSPRLHIGLEFLYWWMKKENLPPLVTAGPLTDPVPAALGQPNTLIVSQSERGDSSHSGARLVLAYNFESDPNWAVEGNFFFFEQRGYQQSYSGDGANGSYVVGRPFYFVNQEREVIDPIAVPNAMAGGISIDSPRKLYGGEINILNHYAGQENGRFVMLVGFRSLFLDESLRIRMTSTDLPGLGAAGQSVFVTDEFNLNNDFWGGQIGGMYDFRVGPVSVNTSMKVALGATVQAQRNVGFTQIAEANGTVTTSSTRGLLVQPSNVGRHSRSVVSIVPEAAVNLAYQFNENVRVGVGYTFLYWTGVARPGNQIDRAINIQALQPFDQVGPARPGVRYNSNDFFAHGLTAHLGLSF